MINSTVSSSLIFKDVKLKELMIGETYNISDVLNLIRASSYMKIRHVVLEDEHIYYIDDEKLSILNDLSLANEVSSDIKILEVFDPYKECRERYEEFCELIVSEIKDGISQTYNEIGKKIVGVIAEQLVLMYLSDNFITNKMYPYNSFVKGLSYWFAMKNIKVSSSGDIIYFEKATVLYSSIPTKEKNRYKEFSKDYMDAIKKEISKKDGIVGVKGEQLLMKFINYDSFAQCLNSWFELRGIKVSSSNKNILFKYI